MAALDLASIENFGAIDADEDALLRECFRDHPAYTAAKAHDRFLVVGRKGSGKTAIFKRLITERDPSVFGFGHTFDDYPWHYHDLQAEAGVPEERRYVHSWRYLILMGLAKILLNVDQVPAVGRSGIRSARRPRKLRSRLLWFSRPRPHPALPTREEAPLSKADSSSQLRQSKGWLSFVKDSPLHVQKVNRSVQASVLTALNPDHDYYVCFDQLALGITIDAMTEEQARYVTSWEEGT